MVKYKKSRNQKNQLTIVDTNEDQPIDFRYLLKIIDISICFNDNIDNDSMIEFTNFIRIFENSLSLCDSSREQNVVLQQIKLEIKQDIYKVSDIKILDHFLSILVYFYTHPLCLSIRKSLQWCLDFLRVIKHPSRISNILYKTYIFVEQYITSYEIQKNSKDLFGLSSSLNLFTALNREFQWIIDSNIENSLEIIDSSIIFKLLNVISKILSEIVAKIDIPVIIDLSEGIKAENFQYLEILAELFQSLLNILTFNDGYFIPLNDNQTKQVEIVLSNLMKDCVTIASAANYLSKDLLISNTMAIASLQWVSRFKNKGNVSPTTQLDVFLRCIEDESMKEMPPIFLDDLLYLLRQSNSFILNYYLLRAFVAVYSSDVMLSDSNFKVSDDSFFERFHKLAISLLENSNIEICQLGLYMLTSWFIKIEDFIRHKSINQNILMLSDTGNCCEKISLSSCCLISCWNHPVKQISNMIPSLFSKSLFLFNSITSISSDQDSWQPLIKEIFIHLSSKQRSRYQALTVLLPLLPSGASTLLLHKPDLLNTLVQAIQFRDIASSISTLILTIIESLFQENVKRGMNKDDAFINTRHIWLDSLIEGLLSTDVKLRSNISDFLLNQLMKFDNTCCPSLLKELQRLQSTDTRNILCGRICVISHARYLSLDTNDLDGDILLKGCLSDDENLRLMSLSSLMICSKTNNPVDSLDFEILSKSFSYSLKSNKSDTRQKLLRVIESLMTRSIESCRKIARQRCKQVKVVVNPIELTSTELLSMQAFDWLYSLILNTLYPGTPFEKELSGLEMLKLYLETLQHPSVNQIDIKSYIIEKICDTKVVRLLMNSMISSWDRCRQLSSEIVVRFSGILQMFDQLNQANEILQFALQMVGSSRQREADAGAFLLKTLMNLFCLQSSWSCEIHNENIQFINSSDAIVTLDSNSSSQFLVSMMRLTNNRLQRLEVLFNSFISQNEETFIENSDEEDTSCLCNGLMLAMKLSLMEVNLNKSEDINSLLLVMLQDCALNTLRVGLIVVAEANSDVAFAPFVNEGSKGPMNTTTTMSASYVNVNSIISTTQDEDGDFDDKSSSAIQRAVVAAWLLVKESISLLAYLVKLSCERKSSNLPEEKIGNIGDVVLNTLGRLKHMGAIYETQCALQLICESILRCSNYSSSLNNLPLQWLDSLLDRLQNREQHVFILRRSAGFAYSFLSILKSEPSNVKSTLVPKAMHALLSNIHKGIHLDIDSDESNQFYFIKLAVHSLNVLRLILLDTSLSSDINSFIDETAILAIQGFQSSHWSVRNSSMMVYTSIVQRCVSNDKNDTAFVGMKNPTIIEFFQRHPKLLHACVNELKNALNSLTTSYDIQPSVFPILLLISKLRSLQTTSKDALRVYDLILPSIECFVFVHSHHIRLMAAKAIASLTPLDQITNKIESQLQLIIKDNKTLSLNSRHGIILSCLELVSTLLQNIQNSDSQVLSHKMSLIQSLESIGTITLPCLLLHVSHVSHISHVSHVSHVSSNHPIQYLSLRLMKSLLNVMKVVLVNDQVISYVQQLIHCFCWYQYSNDCINKTHHLPYASLTCRDCIMEIVNSLVSSNTNDAISSSSITSISLIQLIDLLHHDVMEVRQGVVDGLLQSFTTCQLSSHEVNVILNKLVMILQMETYPILLTTILQLIYLMLKRSLEEELIVINDIQVFVIKLMDLCCYDRDGVLTLYQTTISGLAIKILGHIVYLKHNDNTTSLIEYINKWMLILDEASDESQSIDIREAIVSSISSSNIFKESIYSNPIFLRVKLQLFIILLKLLQDDDEDIRNETNRYLCLEVFHMKHQYVTVVEYTLENRIAKELSYLSNLIYISMREVDSIIDLYLTLIDRYFTIQELSMTCQDTNWSVQKVFDAEQANVYIEPLTLFNVIISTLDDLMDSNIGLVPIICSKLYLFIQPLLEVLFIYQSNILSKNWISGWSYEPTIFRYTFAVLRTIFVITRHDKMNDLGQDKYKLLLKSLFGSENNTSSHPILQKLYQELF